MFKEVFNLICDGFFFLKRYFIVFLWSEFMMFYNIIGILNVFNYRVGVNICWEFD